MRIAILRNVALALLALSLGTAARVSSSSRQGHVTITKLNSPAYPPLALQTGIAGDVELVLEVRADGTVTSTEVVGGHPLLRQAALDSAQKSQFECRNCGGEGTSYRLIYSFQLGPTIYCSEASNGNTKDSSQAKEEPYPRLTQSENKVTLVAQPVGTCDLAGKFEFRKLRSIKCLYLWRCARPKIVVYE